jgi:3'-phosphoadenosine 5'-phosphosulfate synthase
MTEAERKEFNALPTLEIEDLEQVNYLHTIAEGWAYPLNRFMNEQELLESMNMNTITGADGKKHMLSVPITHHITKAQKEQFKDCKRIALKCKAISDDVLAVIEEPEFFDNRKEEICTKTFGTRSKKHPKIERIE